MANKANDYSIIPHGFDQTVTKVPRELVKILLTICMAYRAYAKEKLMVTWVEGRNIAINWSHGQLTQLSHRINVDRKVLVRFREFGAQFDRRQVDALSVFPFVIEWQHLENYVQLGPTVILGAAASSINIAEFSERLEHARKEAKKARAQQLAAERQRRAARKMLAKLQPKLSKSESINLNRKLLASWGINPPEGTAVQMKVSRDKSKITLILGLEAEYQRQRRAARKSLAKPQPKLTREGSINLNKKLLDPWGINLPTVIAVQMKVSQFKTNITLILD